MVTFLPGRTSQAALALYWHSLCHGMGAPGQATPEGGPVGQPAQGGRQRLESILTK